MLVLVKFVKNLIVSISVFFLLDPIRRSWDIQENITKNDNNMAGKNVIMLKAFGPNSSTNNCFSQNKPLQKIICSLCQFFLF